MRLINIAETEGQIRMEFAGCNMKCPYCVHIHQPFTDVLLDKALEFARSSAMKTIYLGGAEPTLQKELLPLLEGLHDAGKQVLLKSNGMKPDVIEQSLPFVHGIVLEIKAPLDDVDGLMELTGMSRERTEKYIDLLKQSLSIAKQKWLRVWLRVIPEFVNKDSIYRILPDVEGADEMMLYQFMSKTDFDRPFLGHVGPTPSWEELEELGIIAMEKIPKVILLGEKGRIVLGK
ncbi:radical SAM protein [Methanomethylovorans sp.]|uniref:radical SAM protein n=1 Tax=Methanomethylovorans sp. TaxID=2758717 RepID=UPI00351C3CF6